MPLSQMNESLIRKMMPNAGSRLTPHLPFIVPALQFGKIVTIPDICAFMAQCAHESGEYRYTREIHDGSDYEGREDLGNIYPGDGKKYPGRGAIQNTGRNVARAAGEFFGQPFEEHPELMEKPEWATHVSVFFWVKYKFGLQAASLKEWFRVTTKLVNGGYNHFQERINYYQNNRKLFGMRPWSVEWEDGNIRSFQSEQGLVVDGVAGNNTLKRLVSITDLSA